MYVGFEFTILIVMLTIKTAWAPSKGSQDFIKSVARGHTCYIQAENMCAFYPYPAAL